MLLLARGAEADARGSHEETPLHDACLHGHRETALLLVSRGADINVTDNDGESPIDVTRVEVVHDDDDDDDDDDYDDDWPIDEEATEAMRDALRRERKKYLAWMRRKAVLAVLSESGCLRANHQQQLQQQSLSQPLGEDTLVAKVLRVAHRDIASYI